MFTLYLSQLATGYIAMLLLVPYTLLGKKFFRFNLWVPLLLFIFIAGIQSWDQPGVLAVFCAPIASLLLYFGVLQSNWRIKGKKQIFLFFSFLCSVGVLGFLAHSYQSTHQDNLSFFPFLLIWLHFLSSAILLGSALVAMVLGHFYLTIPKLSFGPLKRLTLAFIGAILFRILLTAALLGIHWNLWTVEVYQDLMGYFMSHLHILSLRFLAGLLVPSVLAYMVWDCVKRQSNQSATGILYVACFLIMMGEFGSSWYFLQEKVLL